MRFSVRIECLLEALKSVVWVIQPKSPLENLAGVCFSTRGPEITVRATDLDTTATAKVDFFDLEQPGEAVVRAKELLALLMRIPNERFVTIEAENEKAKLIYPDGEAEFATYPTDEFPLPPEVEPKMEAQFDGTFREAAARVVYAASKDVLRPAFTGVNFSFRNDKVFLVATDGHRLAMYRLPCDAAENADFLIPARVIAKLPPDPVTILFNDNLVQFKFPEVEITTRFIDQLHYKFPDWQRVIPTDEPKTKVTASTGELLPVLDRVRAIIDKDIPIIVFSFGLEEMSNIKAESTVGKIVEQLPVTVEGDALEIAFNIRYLTDALKGTTDVEIGLYGETGPAVIREGGYLAMVLPMHKKGGM